MSLKAFLDEKTQEANKLSAKIEELEIQLDKEQEDSRRSVLAYIGEMF